MHEYHFRIHVDNENLSLISEVHSLLQETTSRWCRAKEIGTNNGRNHYHYYLKSPHPVATLRSKLVKVTKRHGFAGNQVYSLTKLRKDPVDLISYMMKGDMFEQGTIEQELYDKSRNLSDSIAASRKKPKKSTVFNDLYEQVKKQSWCQCLGKSLRVNDELILKETARTHLKSFILEYLTSNDNLIRTSVIQAYYDTILVRENAVAPEDLFSLSR